MFSFVFSFTVPASGECGETICARAVLPDNFLRTISDYFLYSHKDISDENYVVGWMISSWPILGGGGRHNKLIL